MPERNQIKILHSDDVRGQCHSLKCKHLALCLHSGDLLVCLLCSLGTAVCLWAPRSGSSGKCLPANAGNVRDGGLIPGSGRSPGEEHGNFLQYSCLVNPTDRGPWWATVLRVAQSLAQLKQLVSHTRTTLYYQYFTTGFCGCFVLLNLFWSGTTGSPESLKAFVIQQGGRQKKKKLKHLILQIWKL